MPAQVMLNCFNAFSLKLRTLTDAAPMRKWWQQFFRLEACRFAAVGLALPDYIAQENDER